MYNIAIIGAGQLGSRHLQGLKLAQLPMHIEIVDNSEKSLETARERYDQIEANPLVKEIKYLGSLDDLAPELDLVIIATGSAPRRAILEDLLAKKTVKNLLLEKVLFPRVQDYQAVDELLAGKGLTARTWVNCTRRTFEGYKKLREELRDKAPLQYEKTGSDWGLGCNSIHFIDHFAFLTDDKNIPALDLSGLDKKIYDSKRTGYVEFTGTVSGVTNNGNIFVLKSGEKAGIPQSIVISHGDNRYDIDEVNDKILKNGNLWSNIGMKYQSALTHIVAEQILLENRCDLAGYTESAHLHLAFLRPLVQFYNSLTGKDGDYCPIT